MLHNFLEVETNLGARIGDDDGDVPRFRVLIGKRHVCWRGTGSGIGSAPSCPSGVAQGLFLSDRSRVVPKLLT